MTPVTSAHFGLSLISKGKKLDGINSRKRLWEEDGGIKQGPIP